MNKRVLGALISCSILIAACSNSEYSDDKSNMESSSNRGDGGVSSFYEYKMGSPESPGVLLREEPVAGNISMSSASSSSRILYSSTNGIDGVSPEIVSGLLYLPKMAPPSGGWPLILISHGTVGIADICAPSWSGFKPHYIGYLNKWLEQGYAIVASDYQGLGTPGTHPYLATRPASYSNLDVIRAVQGADHRISKKVVLVGQSQGAAAAFATAGHAQNYAPELDIRGVVVTGIPFFSPEGLAAVSETRPKDVVDPMLGYNFLALTLVELLDSKFKMEDFVSNEAISSVNEFNSKCYQDMQGVIVNRGLTYNISFKQSPSESLKVAFREMGYPSFKLKPPVFVGTGDVDRDTPPKMQKALIRKACVAGSIVESRIYEGFDHRGVMVHSMVDSIPFVAKAFAGERLTGNCE